MCQACLCSAPKALVNVVVLDGTLHSTWCLLKCIRQCYLLRWLPIAIGSRSWAP